MPDPPPRPEPYEVRIIEDRWANFRHVIEAVAILAAGAWAFYTFVYQEKLKPASQPAALAVGIDMRELGHTTGHDIVGIRLSFHNAGQTEIDIAADGFTVWGERFGTRVVENRFEKADINGFERGLGMVSKQVVRSSMELRDMAVHGHPGNHIVLEPADNETVETTVELAHGAYDLLYARVIAVPCKTSETAKIPVSIKRETDGSYWLTFAKGSDATEDDNDAYFSVPQ